MIQLSSAQHIHIIGIGGAGMSPIARILLERGYTVSGSDRTPNAISEALARDGATIHTGHSAENVIGADMVITTSAAPDDHIEIVTARTNAIPVYKRRDILAPLMAAHKVIAVAGTHGKTTTTGLIVHLLRECGRDPSYIVGGVMGNTGTNAADGRGDLFVVEADEYDDMFLGLRPDTIVLTSIEYDHPDYFTSPEMMLDKFAQFVRLLQPGGRLIACMDYPMVQQIIAQNAAGADIIGYSTQSHPAAAMQAHDIRLQDGDSAFDLHIITGGQINVNVGAVQTPLLGEHNVANSIAALTAADVHGVMLSHSIPALAGFKSTARRFELRGTAGDVVVYDDYAHHPTAIELVCKAARARYPDRPLWIVWQPHMYSRTQTLIADYARAFTAADRVIVTDIYAAREAAIAGVSGAWAAEQIQQTAAHHSGDIDATADYLVANVPDSAVIVIMSAGDAPAIGQRFLAARRG
ncbi:MAG: UDP-N-acetylmuramate--L-alanine ligase [Anaerolineaceae bacterium]|nr:MAG: UDP-N-acetylmuramate--L-alanine ligase [Anaerolineaceae bacterium]